MDLRMKCECGARLRAKPSLAGKTLPCPVCRQLLTVAHSPDKRQAAADHARSTDPTSFEAKCECGYKFLVPNGQGGDNVKCLQCGAIVVIPLPMLADQDALSAPSEFLPALGEPLGDLLDDCLPEFAGNQTTPANCPNCNAPLAPKAILCVSCGYHLQTGRRLGTVVERTSAQLPSLPEGVEVNQTKSMLTINTQGRTQSGYEKVAVLFMLLLLISFPLSLLFNSMIASSVGAMSTLIIFGFGGYVIASAYSNRQVVEVTSSHVTIQTKGPIPWPDVVGRVPVADIEQLYVVEKVRKRRSGQQGGSSLLSSALTALDVDHNDGDCYIYIYDLHVRLANGRRRRLLTSHDRRLTKYIARKVANFLALPETPVLSTWYQRWLLRESTLFDDRDDIDYETAVFAKSLSLAFVVLGCLLVLLLGGLLYFGLAPAAATILAN